MSVALSISKLTHLVPAHRLAVDDAVAMARACIFFLLAHSLLEYPLWHLYFLIPLGLLVGMTEPMTTTPVRSQVRAQWVLVPIGVMALAAAWIMKADYDAVALCGIHTSASVSQRARMAPKRSRACSLSRT